MWLYFVVVGFLFLVLIYNALTSKYVNPYTLTFIFAKKGQGKSTLLTKLAYKYRKKGWQVFSTEPIPGCWKIDYTDIGVYSFPENSCIIIDEVGMIWDARDFNKFPAHVRDFWKLQRHYKLKCVLASQTFDVDKKIRDMADDMYLLEKKFRVFSYGKRIIRRLKIIEAQGGAESRITDDMKFDSFLFFWAGSRTLTFIPAWVNKFDSFSIPQLKQKIFTKIPDFEIKPAARRRWPRSRRSVEDVIKETLEKEEDS